MSVKDFTRKHTNGQLVRRDDGFVVGQIKDGILKKKAKASRHMLRQPRGWAWDVSILEEAKLLGQYTQRF